MSEYVMLGYETKKYDANNYYCRCTKSSQQQYY